MNVKVLNEDGEKLEIEVDDMTLVNIIHENLWKKKIDYAAWAKDHPVLSKPVLAIKSKDPKKSLIEAAEKVIDDVDDLRKKFNKEVK